VDDQEDRVFGVLKVKVTQGGKVETEVVTGDNQKNVLPESLRRELKEFVEGKVAEDPNQQDEDK
jgi:hypothetical protein